ncbi:MAG: hypothetical protein HYS43_00025 [Candidatus Liptonbacteria bacterium]|nr:hypothetical protein [Candidatus Liptonbacteria bacterium]
MGSLLTAIYRKSKRHTGADFSNQEEDWLDLRDCVFTDCDFRNTRMVGTGVSIAGVQIIVSSDKTHLLEGLTVEERNAVRLAGAITFGDPEAQANTEEGLAMRQMTPRKFLDMLGIVVVPNADLYPSPSPAPAARTG